MAASKEKRGKFVLSLVNGEEFTLDLPWLKRTDGELYSIEDMLKDISYRGILLIDNNILVHLEHLVSIEYKGWI